MVVTARAWNVGGYNTYATSNEVLVDPTLPSPGTVSMGVPINSASDWAMIGRVACNKEGVCHVAPLLGAGSGAAAGAIEAKVAHLRHLVIEAGSTEITTVVGEQLGVSWSGFNDNAGIRHYTLCIGKNRGEADVLACTDVGKYTSIVTGRLALQHLKSYYAVVTAYDGAGNTVSAFSRPVRVFSAAPAATTVTELDLLNTEMEVSYSSSCDRVVAMFRPFALKYCSSISYTWRLCILGDPTCIEELVAPSGSAVSTSPISVTGESFELEPGVLTWSEVHGVGCAGPSLETMTSTSGFVCDLTAPTSTGEPMLANECGSTSAVSFAGSMVLTWDGVFFDRESPIVQYDVCLEDSEATFNCESSQATWMPAALATTIELLLPEGVLPASAFTAVVRATNAAGLAEQAASNVLQFDESGPSPVVMTVQRLFLSSADTSTPDSNASDAAPPARCVLNQTSSLLVVWEDTSSEQTNYLLESFRLRANDTTTLEPATQPQAMGNLQTAILPPAIIDDGDSLVIHVTSTNKRACLSRFVLRCADRVLLNPAP